jgi:PBP1b-binding outer membrane lipoprotein LpoB
MKRVLLVTAIALTLSACSSVSLNKADNPGSMTPIQSQKLTSNFTRKGIKLEFDCAFGTGAFGMTDAMCSKTDIKAIEVTAYAPSFGNSENNRENAFRVAEMRAKAKLRHFINEDVSSSQTKQVIAKNIEKANDRIKQRISANEEVNMTDDEATKETNFAIRENTNDTVQTLTEVVRVNAQGIMRGVRAIDEKIVDRQTVQVTIRWDKDSDRASEFFRNKWRVQQ